MAIAQRNMGARFKTNGDGKDGASSSSSMLPALGYTVRHSTRMVRWICICGARERLLRSKVVAKVLMLVERRSTTTRSVLYEQLESFGWRAIAAPKCLIYMGNATARTMGTVIWGLFFTGDLSSVDLRMSAKTMYIDKYFRLFLSEILFTNTV